MKILFIIGIIGMMILLTGCINTNEKEVTENVK